MADAAMDTIASLAQHAALIDALRATGPFADPEAQPETFETHISTVLLAGAYAYKIKKPVDLGFADFSTLALRHRYCLEELRLNRRAAPDLYLDVVAITGAPDRPRMGEGGGPVLDYAVRMRRFPSQARLDEVARAGLLTPQLIDRLAHFVADFHARCEPARRGSDYASVEDVRHWILGNLAELQAAAAVPAAREPWARLQQWTLDELAKRAATIRTRQVDGHVRECHGDLHLGNVVLLDGAPVPFDCIEFNDRLRFIDVINDAAFMFMDLIAHDRAPLAWRFVGTYLDRTGDWQGLAVLRLYAAYRALVRAKIARIRDRQAADPPDADATQRASSAPFGRYLETALRLAAPPPRRLVLTCGVAGSGKTTVAQMLLERLGAVRIRSDVERKRRFGIEASNHGGNAAVLYDPTATRQTYLQMLEAAGAVLDADLPVLVDATFQRRDDRAMFAELARERGIPFDIVHCRAAEATLRARVGRRLAHGGDASDATATVLERQLRGFEALTPAELPRVIAIDTDRDLQALQAHCAQIAAAWGGTNERPLPGSETITDAARPAADMGDRQATPKRGTNRT